MGIAKLLFKSKSSEDNEFVDLVAVAAAAAVVVVVVVEDSIIELDRPGEEKKKRWEVNAVMKSTATWVSESPPSLVGTKNGLESRVAIS